MNTSILVARLVSVVYLLVAFGILINPKYYQKMLHQVMKDSSLLYFSGIMATLAGTLILIFHHTWKNDWTILITIIGWMALLKGFFLLVVPEHTQMWSKLFKKSSNMTPVAILILVLGLFLAYMGWVV